MKKWQNVLIQSIFSVGQVANVAAGDNLIPKDVQPFIAMGMGIFQLYVSKKAHEVNPDGTPASVAFQDNASKLKL